LLDSGLFFQRSAVGLVGDWELFVLKRIHAGSEEAVLLWLASANSIRLYRQRQSLCNSGRHATRVIDGRSEAGFRSRSVVGAINASYFAGAPNAEGLATLERIWSGLRRADIFPSTPASAIGLIRPSAMAATVRTGPGQWFAEFVATFGPVADNLRMRSTNRQLRSLTQ
jgi:hypothetical protein